MDDISTESGLAFCLDGDARIYSTSRKVARVPLSDYITSSPSRDLVPQSFQVEIEAIKRLEGLTATLLSWQEQQSILLHIDDRFRFRCLLSWLSSHTAAMPKRITVTAAHFLEAHVVAQYKLLLLEAEGLQEIGEARQDNGMRLTEDHLQQVRDVSRDLGDIEPATEWIRELVKLCKDLGLVADEEAVVAGAEPDVKAGQDSVQDGMSSGQQGREGLHDPVQSIDGG